MIPDDAALDAALRAAGIAVDGTGPVRTPLDDEQPLDPAALAIVRQAFPANRPWQGPTERSATSHHLAAELEFAASKPPICGASDAPCPETYRGAVCQRVAGHSTRHRWGPRIQGGSHPKPRPAPVAVTSPIAPTPTLSTARSTVTKVVMQIGSVATITIEADSTR